MSVLYFFAIFVIFLWSIKLGGTVRTSHQEHSNMSFVSKFPAHFVARMFWFYL